jgi:proteasome lid subunit RPN8/RPN11
LNRFRPKSRSSVALLWRDRPVSNSSLVGFASIASNFEVYLQNEVLTKTLEVCKNALPNETIGLLAGRTCQDSHGPYTVITAAEAALGDEIESTPAEVRISGAGYAQLRGRLETSHPVLEVIGWFHSHPLTQPLLSKEDLIEQLTWTDNTNIALVVSLVSDGERFGLFHGPDAVLLFQRSIIPSEGEY